MKLPTYDEAVAQVFRGTATSIERFIDDNEPINGASYWRCQLLDALNQAAREGVVYTEI